MEKQTLTQTMANPIEVEVTEVAVGPTAPVKVMEEDGTVNTALISAADRERYGKMTQSLKVTDINSITNYGADLSSVMSKSSNAFLSTRRCSQSGEMGALIDGLLSELDFIKIDDFEDKSGIVKVLRRIPLVNKLVKTADKIMNKYDSIEKNIETIASKIMATRQKTMRDNNALQVLFENNAQYANQIEQLIIAGKLKLEEVKANLEAMLANADAHEAHEIQDAQEFLHNLEKKLNDMVTMRYILKQSLMEIRTVQYNNLALANNAQSIIANTIPVWKNQLTLACAMLDQKEAVEAQHKVGETTELILQKNAQLLHANSVAVAKESERSIVSTETLRKSTEEFIQTLKDVKAIHAEAMNKFSETESILRQLEEETNKTIKAEVVNTPLLN